MVVISGQVPSYAIGEDAFQEVDSVGITRPCVKHNFFDKRRERHCADHQKGFLPCQVGSPRAGAGGYPERHIKPKDRICLPESSQYPLV